MTPPDKITVTLLKPCPFCGGEAAYRSFPDQRHISHYIECAHGPCDVTLCAGNTKAEAIAAWNTRAATSDNLTLMREASGVIEGLIGLAVDGGLTNDLVAAFYPDSKKPNGQPLDQFAKRARREINEARATLAKLRDGIARGEG
jgi:Lar family restriction alleviation protein